MPGIFFLLLPPSSLFLFLLILSSVHPSASSSPPSSDHPLQSLSYGSETLPRRSIPDSLITNPTFAALRHPKHPAERAMRREILLRTLHLIRQRPLAEFRHRGAPRAQTVPRDVEDEWWKESEQARMNGKGEKKLMLRGSRRQHARGQKLPKAAGPKGIRLIRHPALLGASERRAAPQAAQFQPQGIPRLMEWDAEQFPNQQQQQSGGGDGEYFFDDSYNRYQPQQPQGSFVAPQVAGGPRRLYFYYTRSATMVNQDFTIVPGSPGLACLYGLPVPQYNTPRKRCIPSHPMCGLEFTCVMDVHAVDARSGREVMDQWWREPYEEVMAGGDRQQPWRGWSGAPQDQFHGWQQQAAAG